MTELVDERARSFSDKERRIAKTLAEEGRHVVALRFEPGWPSRPDARVDGEATDFETLEPGATSVALAMALSRAARHSGHAIVDVRSAGLTRHGAREGVRLFGRTAQARSLRGYRIIGDDFDLTDGGH